MRLSSALRGVASSALLLAATFPHLVGPVAVYTPSSVVWVGLDFTQPTGVARSSWSYRGRPFPYLPFPANVAPAHSNQGFSMLPLSEAALEDQDAVERAAIATEYAQGPLLLVSGGDDRVWAAGRMCRMIVDRMSRHRRAERRDATALSPSRAHVVSGLTAVR